MLKNITLAIAVCLPFCAMAQSPMPPNVGDKPAMAAAPVSSLGLLHARLDPLPAQALLWQAFEDAVNAYTTLFYQERPVLASQKDAVPQQLKRLIDTHSNRLAALEDIETAAKNLYAALTPEQQVLANQSLLSTIPVLGSAMATPGGPGREKGERPEGGRGHRSGAPGGAGGMGGGMGGMGR
jgi:hypothetical protein